MPRAYTPEERIRRRVRSLKKLIEMLDRTRAGVYISERDVDRLIKELKLKDAPLRREEVLELLRKIYDIPKSSKDYLRISRAVRVSTYLFLLAMFGIVGSTVVLISGLGILVYLISITVTFIATNIAYVLRIYALAKVDRIYAERKDELGKYSARLKDYIEYLAKKLWVELKKLKVDESTFTLKTLHCDYENMRVISPPTRLRREYILAVSPPGARSAK